MSGNSSSSYAQRLDAGAVERGLGWVGEQGDDMHGGCPSGNNAANLPRLSRIISLAPERPRA